MFPITRAAERAAFLHRSCLPALASGALFAGALAACGAPERAALEPRALDRSLSARALDPEALVAALEAAHLAPLAVPVPSLPAPGEPFRADDPEAWRASAFAWEAETRAARRKLLAARARAGSAGAPMPVRALTEVDELEHPDAHGRLMVTFDLLGLLGLGPAAAARELADALVRSSLSELEHAVWRARIEVDRALARLAAARGERAALAELAGEAGAARVQSEILSRHGRLSVQSLAAAELAQHRLLHRLGASAIAEARARADLGVASGLPAEAAALDAVSAEALRALEPGLAPPMPSRRELLSRAPELRSAVLDYSVAEARVRQAAAERWPSLEIGPHLTWLEDDLLEGILAGSALPWPGSVQGSIAAALEERSAAREAAEDALLALEARARAARARLEAARTMWLEHARGAEAESARAWRAARARFDVEPGALTEWAQAMQMRSEALTALFAARLEAVEAGLDLALALGPQPGSGLSGSSLAAAEEAR